MALLIALQLAASLLGNQIITGSIVNMMLIVSVITSGLATGLSIAVLSPVMPSLLGLVAGPRIELLPFIITGNIVLVILWHFIGNIIKGKRYLSLAAALIVAAIVKFAVLFIGITLIAVPLILKLPEQQAAVVSGAFSIPQLLTASIGGVLAIIVLAALDKGLKK